MVAALDPSCSVFSKRTESGPEKPNQPGDHSAAAPAPGARPVSLSHPSSQLWFWQPVLRGLQPRALSQRVASGSVPSAPRLPGAGGAPRRPRIERVHSGSGPGAPRAQGRPANGWPDPPRHPTDRSCRCLSLSSRRRPHGTGGTCATRRDQSADVLELGFGIGRAGLLVRAETGCFHAAVSLKGGGHAWAGATGAPPSRLLPQAALPRARPARSTHDTEP